MVVVKKRILFAVPNLNGGGAERVMVNMLRALDPQQYEITLLLVDRIGVFFDLVPDYVDLQSLDVKRTRHSLPRLIKSIRANRPDVIVSTTNRMNIFVLIASMFARGKPRVFVREPNLPSAQINNKSLSPFSMRLVRLLYPRAHRVIAQTDEMNQEIHDYFGVPKEKIITLMNPLDTASIDAHLAQAENPFAAGTVNFVAAGRLSYQKGFDNLLRAFAAFAKDKPQYRLTILGEGEERAALEALIDELALADKVSLPGFQPNPHAYIRFADALVLSSRWEGLPNIVLESLYIGTPVIATRVVKMLDEVIDNGLNGQLCEVDDIASLQSALEAAEKLQRENVKPYLSGVDFNRAFA
ncbi:glycosyltransferase [Granulosicoccaceae sp. 1_MG-2023]|nr:glycosyltransferase [Granulosicoccaceae sp. 1_MG-2023]